MPPKIPSNIHSPAISLPNSSRDSIGIPLVIFWKFLQRSFLDYFQDFFREIIWVIPFGILEYCFANLSRDSGDFPVISSKIHPSIPLYFLQGIFNRDSGVPLDARLYFPSWTHLLTLSFPKDFFRNSSGAWKLQRFHFKSLRSFFLRFIYDKF